MMRKYFIPCMLIAVIFFAACDLIPSTAFNERSAGSSSATVITLTYPYDDQHLALGEVCDVKSEGVSPAGASTVTLLVNNAIYRQDKISNPFTNARVYQPWTPRAVGTYVLQTMLEEGDSAQVASNSVTVFVDEAEKEPAEEITPEAPPAEEDIEECPQPIATTNSYANCRSGPGTAYNLIVGLKPNQSFPLTGKSVSGIWFRVERDAGGGTCWIWTKLIDICGNSDNINVIALEEKDEVIVEGDVTEEPPEAPPSGPTIPTKDSGAGPTTP